MPKVFSIPVSKVDIQKVNDGDFLKLKMYIISDGLNRNNSEFMRDGFEESIKTIYNKPVLAYFNTKLNDAEEHNSRLDIDSYGNEYYDYDYHGAEKPVGVIPESADIYIEEVDGKNWIVVDNAYIWTEYNKKLSDLIQRQGTKKVSVEIESISSHEENNIEYIHLWKFLGVTILGKTPDGIPIQEGIEGAHLSLKDYAESEMFSAYKSRFTYAISNVGNYKSDILEKYGVEFNKGKTYMETFISKDKYGTGKSISVDKSRDSVSNDSWGDVDKTALRNTVLEAKNYKMLVKSVYLNIEDGWEDSPSSKLKYPVMQYKNGKFVYNSGGLLSAQQYGEKNDEAVAKKALTIRKRLGLVKSEKEEKMKKFIEAAKISGFAFLGISNGKLLFAKEEEADKEEMAEKNELSLFEVDKETAECYKEDEDFAWDELTGRSIGLTTRDDGNHHDYDDENEDEDEEKDAENDMENNDEDEDEEDRKEMEARIECLEREKKELASRCEMAERELEEIRMTKFKEDTDAILADEDEDMDEKTHEELVKMRDEGKFKCVEEFEKEIAYRKYLEKKEKEKEVMSRKSLSFSIDHSSEKKISKKSNLINKLEKI